jgi:murein DD-endopeptidase MepM/ murein hydrolase activator NlpD
LLKTKFASARINSLRGPSLTPLMLTALLAVSFGMAGHFSHHTSTQATASAPVTTTLEDVRAAAEATPVAEAGAKLAEAIAPAPFNATRETELDEGQTFAEMLTDQGIAEGDALAAMNALAKIYDMRKLRAGQDISLTFARTDTKETLTSAIFQPEDTKEITLSRNADNSFTGHVSQIPISRHRMAAAGEIRSSLYEAGDRAGLPHALMASLIRIYSHSIDFQRDVQSGDTFEVLYDQSRTAKGKAVGESTIVYAMFHVNGKAHTLYRVTFSDGTADYFDERGQSVRRALLRTPVAAAHITSGFGMRIHPLLGYSKMHKGVDFGAPTGTPIFAAGSGVIDEVGFKGGYGRYIRIRHNGSMATAYAHMSRFATHMFRGARINQGEVIGYVGMSGRATGPHLHFEVQKGGQQVNPMSVDAMPTGRQMDGRMLAVFKDGQSKIHKEFENLLAKPSMTAASATAPGFTPKTTASN